MIVAATFNGRLNATQLFWSMDVTGNDAAIDAHWIPNERGRHSANVSFKLDWDVFGNLFASFSCLESTYNSSLDGAAIRYLSVNNDGVLTNCIVHGTPSQETHPELKHFYAIWRIVERTVHDEMGWNHSK